VADGTSLRGRIRWLAFRLAVIGASGLAGLAIAEIALRTVAADYSPITFDVYSRDADGQLRLEPGARRQHTTPEWSVAIEITQDGFRGPADPGSSGDRPVLLALGDSFAFGWGVEAGETFLARTGRSLAEGGQRVRIFNAAVPGTGTTDQLALLTRLLRTESPSVVLAGFYAGNDFQDVADGGAAQFDVVDGLLVRRGLEGGAFDRLRAWVKRKSYVAQVLARQWWIAEQRRTSAEPVASRAHPGLEQRDTALRQFMQIHLREPLPAALAAGVDGTRAALDEMRRLSEARGARFVVLVVPRNVQVYEDDRRRYETAFGIAPDGWDLDRPQAILAAWASSRGVEYVDPLPALRREAASGPRLYYFPDSHLTARGHAAIAAVLSQYFAAHPLPAARPAGSR
jgi:hypothetical protein